MKTKQEFEIITGLTPLLSSRRVPLEGDFFFNTRSFQIHSIEGASYFSAVRLLIGIQLLLLLNDTVAENKFGESRVKFFKSFSCTISLENQVLETEESLSPHSERIKSY